MTLQNAFSDRLIGRDRWVMKQPIRNERNFRGTASEQAEFRLKGNYPNWPIRLMKNAPNKPPERADQTSRTRRTFVSMETTELANQVDKKRP